MKRFVASAALLAGIFFAVPLYAAVVDYGVVPRDADCIATSGDLKAVISAISNFTSDNMLDDDLKYFSLIENVIDLNRMMIAGIDLETISNAFVSGFADDLTNFAAVMSYGGYFLVPVKYPLEKLADRFDFSDQLSQAGAGVYQMGDVYLTDFKTSAGNYLLLAWSTEMIATYVQSVKLTANPPASSRSLAAFLNADRNFPAALYMSGRGIKFYMNVLETEGIDANPEVITNLESYLKDSAGSVTNAVDNIDYAVASVDSFSLPVHVRLRYNLTLPSAVWTVLSPERSTAAVNFDPSMLLFAEADVQPRFIGQVMRMTGLTNGKIDLQEYERIAEVLTGTFAGALYSDSDDPSRMMSSNPGFVFSVGVNDPAAARSLLVQAGQFTVTSISGKEALVFPVSMGELTNFYVFIDKRDVVFASGREFLANYIRSAARGERSFASGIANPAGFDQPLTVSVPSEGFLNAFLSMTKIADKFQTLHSVVFGFDIAADRKSYEIRLDIR